MTKKLDNPCWKGYKPVGMKTKDGKQVPNCVPIEDAREIAAVPKKYSHITFKPGDAVAKAAQRGLDLRKKWGRGGTAVGVARARDLSNGKELSPSTVKRMKAYFDRHSSDKSGEGWGTNSAGYIAWLLWGGDSGYSWAKKVCKQMDAADAATAGINFDNPQFCVISLNPRKVKAQGDWKTCTQYIRDFDKTHDEYVDLRIYDLSMRYEYDSHKSTPTLVPATTVLSAVKQRLARLTKRGAV